VLFWRLKIPLMPVVSGRKSTQLSYLSKSKDTLVEVTQVKVKVSGFKCT
jgi:hypothetical protein